MPASLTRARGPMHETTGNADLAVSREGTMTVADVSSKAGRSSRRSPCTQSGSGPSGVTSPCWADGSAHRLLSDLTPLLWDQRRHPVLIAGDWNILYRYGEHGDAAYRDGYATVFDRAEALGLRLWGRSIRMDVARSPGPLNFQPTAPACRLISTRNKGQRRRAGSSTSSSPPSQVADRVVVRAMYGVDEWGRSDHCRILIDIAR